MGLERKEIEGARERRGESGREWSERERGVRLGRERVGREIERGVSGAIERGVRVERERVFRKDFNEIFEPSLVYCLDLLCSLQSFSGIM